MFEATKKATSESMSGKATSPAIRIVAAMMTGAMLMLGGSVAAKANQNQQHQTAPRNGALTVEQLGDDLEVYGKNTINNNGNVVYSIDVQKGKWNINLLISLSPNGRVIWITNDMMTLPADPNSVATPALVNLLKKNNDIGPMFFSIAGRKLRLSYPVANHDLTPDLLKAYVDAVLTTVVESASLWDSATLNGR
jgi:hypothetical protein